MVRMVIFYAEKYNHCGALIFSNLLHMVLMVINVYIILIYIIIVYIFIYTIGIIKIIRSFSVTIKNRGKNVDFSLEYQVFVMVIFEI